MKRILLCIFIIIGMYGNELDYNDFEDDYVESNVQQNTQKRTNNAKTRQNRQKQTSNAQTYEARKQAKLRELAAKKRLDYDRKEAQGLMLGAGINIATRSFQGGKEIDNIVYIYGSQFSGARNGLDFVFGYKWIANTVFGHRLYISYNPNFGGTDNLYNAHDIALNYDILVNFVKTKGFKFGMLFGINLGVYQFNVNPSLYDTVFNNTFFDFGGSIGFRFGIFRNHSIETMFQLKGLASSSNSKLETVCNYSPILGRYCFDIATMQSEILSRVLVRYVYTF